MDKKIQVKKVKWLRDGYTVRLTHRMHGDKYFDISTHDRRGHEVQLQRYRGYFFDLNSPRVKFTHGVSQGLNYCLAQSYTKWQCIGANFKLPLLIFRNLIIYPRMNSDNTDWEKSQFSDVGFL